METKNPTRTVVLKREHDALSLALVRQNMALADLCDYLALNGRKVSVAFIYNLISHGHTYERDQAIETAKKDLEKAENRYFKFLWPQIKTEAETSISQAYTDMLFNHLQGLTGKDIQLADLELTKDGIVTLTQAYQAKVLSAAEYHYTQADLRLLEPLTAFIQGYRGLNDRVRFDLLIPLLQIDSTTSPADILPLIRKRPIDALKN